MKSFLFSAIAISGLLVSPIFAGENEKEFLKLREKRDLAVAAASKPVNDLYRSSLEQMLKRVVAEKDTATAAKIQFELQALSAEGAASILPATKAQPADGKADGLRQQLAGTRWRINPDKTFVLNGDGSTASNWTQRPGRWKIVESNIIEISIWNVDRPEKVSVDQGGALLTWLAKEADQPHAMVAKKIVSEIAL